MAKYPIIYKGEKWFKKDVNELFEIFYHNEATLEPDGSVYMLEGDYIFPDGKIAERGANAMIQHHLKSVVVRESN